MRDFQDNFQETHNGAVEKLQKFQFKKHRKSCGYGLNFNIFKTTVYA